MTAPAKPSLPFISSLWLSSHPQVVLLLLLTTLFHFLMSSLGQVLPYSLSSSISHTLTSITLPCLLMFSLTSLFPPPDCPYATQFCYSLPMYPFLVPYLPKLLWFPLTSPYAPFHRLSCPTVRSYLACCPAASRV